MHWIERLSIWVSLVLMAIIAFEMLGVVDQQLPVGTRVSFTVNRVDTATKDEAVRAIDAASRDLGINVFKIQPPLRGSMESRTLIAFIGDQESFQNNGGYVYPSFSTHGQATTVVASDTITTQDLRGNYATNANDAQMQQLYRKFADAHIVVGDSQNVWMDSALTALGRGGLSAGVSIVAIVLMIATAYSLSANKRIHAIKALHGYTSRSILAAELLSLVATIGIGLLAVAVTGLPFLWFFNNFHQIGRFLKLLLIAVCPLIAYLVVLVVFLGGATTFRNRIPAVIDGEGNALRDGVLAFVSQFMVMAMIFGTIGGAMDRISAIRSTNESLEQWSRIADQYVLRLSLNTTQADLLHEAPSFMKVVRDLDGQGKVLMAGYKGGSVVSATGEEHPYEPEGSDSMIVNPNYLKKQQVLGMGGKPITIPGAGVGEFTLLVPSSYGEDTGALMDAYISYFKGKCQEPGSDDSTSCNPHGTIIRTRANQDVSLFAGTQFMPAETQQHLSLNNPVIAVTAPSSGLINSMEYLSYTSMDSVLFSDPVLLQNQLEQYGIMEGFQGIDNAKDSVAYTVSLSRSEQRGDLIAIVLGSAAFIMAILVCSAVYCARRRRLSFVQFIHGYGFVRRHGLFLAVQSVAMLAALVLAGRIGSMYETADFMVGFTLFCVFFLIMHSTVAIYESRFRADDIKRP